MICNQNVNCNSAGQVCVSVLRYTSATPSRVGEVVGLFAHLYVVRGRTGVSRFVHPQIRVEVGGIAAMHRWL